MNHKGTLGQVYFSGFLWTYLYLDPLFVVRIMRLGQLLCGTRLFDNMSDRNQTVTSMILAGQVW